MTSQCTKEGHTISCQLLRILTISRTTPRQLTPSQVAPTKHTVTARQRTTTGVTKVAAGGILKVGKVNPRHGIPIKKEVTLGAAILRVRHKVPNKMTNVPRQHTGGLIQLVHGKTRPGLTNDEAAAGDDKVATSQVCL